ncbi:MAG: PLP-dependent transferase [Paracoccaceae bacterium]
MAVSQKKQLEITFGLLRLNVGIEDTQDIIQDLSLALSLLPNEKILL